MNKLDELDKLKYWLDAELTVIKIFLSVILYQLIENRWFRILLAVYVVMAVIYMGTRYTYISKVDRNYLKVPKKWTS